MVAEVVVAAVIPPSLARNLPLFHQAQNGGQRFATFLCVSGREALTEATFLLLILLLDLPVQ